MLRCEAAAMKLEKHAISLASGLAVLIALFCGCGVTKAQGQSIPDNKQTNVTQAEKAKAEAEAKAQAEKAKAEAEAKAQAEKAKARVEQEKGPGDDGSGNDDPPVIVPHPPTKPKM
jgi:colicin import membrane protein